MKQILVLLGLALLFLFVCGCSQPAPVQPVATVTAIATPTIVSEQPPVTVSPTPQKTLSVSDNTINIKNFAFDPASLTVKAGATVRWVNGDSVPHRIQFADKTLSPVLSSSQSYSTIFDRPGVYDYTCSIHPSMNGTVIVE